MSTTTEHAGFTPGPSSGAIAAAKLINRCQPSTDPKVYPREIGIARIIDRETAAPNLLAERDRLTSTVAMQDESIGQLQRAISDVHEIRVRVVEERDRLRTLNAELVAALKDDEAFFADACDWGVLDRSIEFKRWEAVRAVLAKAKQEGGK